MKVKVIAAIIMGLAVAGCGGGNDDNPTASSGASGSASGANGSTGSTGSGASGSGSTSSGDTAAISGTGSQYLGETAQSAQSDLQQSQIVAPKTTNPDVRMLAQLQASQATVINQQVTQISQSGNVTINNNITSQQQQQINNLSTQSGSALDRAYVQGVVSDWETLLDATLSQARQGTDIAVRQLASANVLAIEQRLALAQQILIVLEPTAYLTDAYQDSQFEIQLGQLALQKATNDQVRQFAQRMIDDHTQISANVSALASQRNVTLPTGLAGYQQQIVTMLSAFSGADFDKAYMDRNVLTHAEDVAKTSVEAERGTDSAIRALAAQTLPVLQAHLQMAQSIDANLQGSPLYRLGQGLTTQMQLAMLTQLRGSGSQTRGLGQQLLALTQTRYAQLVALARQNGVEIPLAIPPGQVVSLMQLLRTSGADFDRQILSLMQQQFAMDMQTAQSLTTSTAAGAGTFAQSMLATLQSQQGLLSGGGTSGTTGSTTTGSSAGTSGSGSTTTGGTTTTGGAATGTTGSTTTGGSATTGGSTTGGSTIGPTGGTTTGGMMTGSTAGGT